jgi:hypothetical protein
MRSRTADLACRGAARRIGTDAQLKHRVENFTDPRAAVSGHIIAAIGVLAAHLTEGTAAAQVLTGLESRAVVHAGIGAAFAVLVTDLPYHGAFLKFGTKSIHAFAVAAVAIVRAYFFFHPAKTARAAALLAVGHVQAQFGTAGSIPTGGAVLTGRQALTARHTFIQGPVALVGAAVAVVGTGLTHGQAHGIGTYTARTAH